MMRVSKMIHRALKIAVQVFDYNSLKIDEVYVI